jgi:lysophospholipase L1-like esterase
LSTITIVGLGDSTTAGTPLFKSPIESPPAGEGDEHSQFAYWLQRAHPEWRVLNRGVNGERSDEIERRFERDVIAHSPRVVVIIAGVNDVYQGRDAAEVTGRLRAMYGLARAAGIGVVAGTIVPYNTATAGQNDQMHRVSAWIAEEARRDSNVLAVDTRTAVAAADNPDCLAGSPDGLHPDIDGYRRMAEALEPAIARTLASEHVGSPGAEPPDQA